MAPLEGGGRVPLDFVTLPERERSDLRGYLLSYLLETLLNFDVD
jgi:hypothetical protein